MANAEVGSAYVSIYPQTDGNFSKLVGSQLDKGSSGLSAKAVALGNVMANAFTSVATRAADALGETITDAFWNYASYEQLVGGVDKLFGDASKQVQSYAAIAYKTSGMSANDYMEQVTGFSASLINSLEGDTEQAAQIADVAMRAMSDNVNTFGTDAQSVQNAIQGISRENYSMLDNLKLGYSGSKEGFKELIDDANAYAESIGEVGDMTTDSFADAIRAIDLIQQKQNIAGTTAKEASSTLEGSLNTAQAAWDNFLTSFGTDSATVSDRFEQLMDALSTAGQNVVQYVATAAGNIFDAVASSLGMTEDDIQGLRDEFARLGKTIYDNIVPYVGQLADSFGKLSKTCEPFTSQVAPVLGTVFKGIVDLITSLIGALALLGSMFLDAANDVINAAGEMWDGAGQAIDALNQGVADAWKSAKESTSEAWETIKSVPQDAANAVKNTVSNAMNAVRNVFSRVWNAAKSTVSGAIGGIKNAIGGLSSLVGSVTSTFNKIKKAITDPIDNARNAVRGALDRIKGMFPLSIGKVFSNLSLPSIHVDGGTPPFGLGGKGSLPSFSVSWNAEGGFTDGITLLGAGERGTELLLPRTGRLMDDFAAAVSSQVDGGNEINVYLQYDASADATEMANDIAWALSRKLAMEV